MTHAGIRIIQTCTVGHFLDQTPDPDEWRTATCGMAFDGPDASPMKFAVFVRSVQGDYGWYIDGTFYTGGTLNTNPLLSHTLWMQIDDNNGSTTVDVCIAAVTGGVWEWLANVQGVGYTASGTKKHGLFNTSASIGSYPELIGAYNDYKLHIGNP